MDIKDILLHRKELKNNIEKTITSHLLEFKKKTNITPKQVYINIDIIDTTVLGTSEKTYTLGEVNTDITLI